MEMTVPNNAEAEPVSSEVPDCMRLGLEPFQLLKQDFQDLKEVLADIEAIGGDQVARQTSKMGNELDCFAPAITFIGQIKSGKTTLVNAMAGRPGLLPADVNPWTSVVTSIHMGVPRSETAPTASFRFFDADEWDHLVQNGGRIGELSARAGADKEHERLCAQIAEMREKTKARLGRKFELLLGQTHDYQKLDEDLIKRYVCLGDDFETANAKDRQGQFADITKSADLYFEAPHLPIALTLRDTPGMNDTFMMREQITIRAIRDSKICVVVLSAHQALSAVDMGLIRMISNVKSRQVVIFVNRVDELANPVAQIPEIRASIKRTLADHNGPEDATLIFGSALWANAAIDDSAASLPDASLEALEAYGSFADIDGLDDMDERDAVWMLSGLPQLYEALGERIAESSGEKTLLNMRKRAANIVSGLRSSYAIVSLTSGDGNLRQMSNDDTVALMAQIEANARARLDQTLDKVCDAFSARVDQAHARYIARALDALMQHLEINGDDEVFSYSADGLRMLMRSAYQVMRGNYRKKVEDVYGITAQDLTVAYGQIFDVTPENFAVNAPTSPDVPAPVTLAQTIVLDVKTSWWKSWWGKRRGYQSFATGFRELIEAETAPMVNDLKVGQIAEIRALAHEALNGFLYEQQSVLADTLVKSEINLDDLDEIFGVSSQEEREYLFSLIFEELDIEMTEMEEAA